MTDREFFIDCDGMKVHAKLDFPDAGADTYKLLILLHGLTGHMEEPHIVAAKDAAVDCGLAVLRPEYFMAARIVPLEECIRNYHGRILLIHGDDAASVPIEYTEKLADKEKKQSGDFTFAVIKGADHDYTRPGNLEQFTGAIRLFLNK